MSRCEVHWAGSPPTLTSSPRYHSVPVGPAWSPPPWMALWQLSRLKIETLDWEDDIWNCNKLFSPLKYLLYNVTNKIKPLGFRILKEGRQWYNMMGPLYLCSSSELTEYSGVNWFSIPFNRHIHTLYCLGITRFSSQIFFSNHLPEKTLYFWRFGYHLEYYGITQGKLAVNSDEN